jgi:hypothetical protein
VLAIMEIGVSEIGVTKEICDRRYVLTNRWY